MTRNGKLVTSVEEIDRRYGRINFYISPKLLYEETGFLWKGEKSPLEESLIVLNANNDTCNVPRFCETVLDVLLAQFTQVVHRDAVDDRVQVSAFHPEFGRIPDLETIRDRNIFRPEYAIGLGGLLSREICLQAIITATGEQKEPETTEKEEMP